MEGPSPGLPPRAKAGLAERERRGVAAIQDELARAQAADVAPQALPACFSASPTGPCGPTSSGRPGRHSASWTPSRKIAALKADLQAERAAFATSQARDMQALNERHKAEDRQFRQAVAARQDFDRAAEGEARRELAQGVKRERGGPDRALTLPCQQLLTNW